MYEWNEEEKKIDFSHNPFSMPNMAVEDFLALDPADRGTILSIKAIQYDIVCNGVELSSGAIRNHRPDIMRKAFAIAGYGEDVLEQKFGGMLRALSLGAPPHGGIAPGIDRIVMLLCGEENLREVVLFPMNQRAEDLMMGAPSEVSPKQLRELHIFRRNNVAGILANSRPNKGTHQLVDAKAPVLWVVPFIRPYRTRDDVQNWSTDPAIYDLIEAEYKRGYFRGVGEFHIYGEAAQRQLVKRVVDFAAERNLYLLAHCDEAALSILLAHNRSAKIIWAHTGFSTPTARVRELLETYPELTGELSYRGGLTDGEGKLAAEWRELFARHSDRFLLGSDTWINERWFGYDTIMHTYRGWLAQLPEAQARRIAHGNAERLFGGKLE
jgi:hypothetical protein